MNVRGLAPLASFLLALAAPGVARAQEVTVPAAYDRLYGTSFSAYGGLATLRQQQGRATPSSWTTAELRYIDVLAFDTSGTGVLALNVNGAQLPLFDPGAWTAPTRGWMPSRGATIDVAQVLAQYGYDPYRTRFGLTVGGVAMDASNTALLAAPEPSEFLLGYNDGGIDYADGDANEPLLRCRRGVSNGYAAQQVYVRPVSQPVYVRPVRVQPVAPTYEPVQIVTVQTGSPTWIPQTYVPAMLPWNPAQMHVHIEVGPR